jgi:hypothetical protein
MCTIAAVICLAFATAPASAATAAPELIAPTASSLHGTPLSVEYKLPEAGSTASISFIPATGPTVEVTLTSPAMAAGKHHFFLDLHNLESETANVAKASASSVPDGEYTVRLRYQNASAEPAAIADAAKVTIKSATAPPVVTEPTPSQTFRKAFTVAYTLPEAALPGSVELLLIGTHAGVKTFTLTNAAAGSHTAEVVPSNPVTGAGIASAPTERLPTDSYQLVLSYQDTLGNPAATSTVLSVGIAYPLCKAGTYSTSGEEPCTKAPKGSFVEGQGATSAGECIAGRYAPEEGLSQCLPAQPGHYVPGTGAKEELECEQGTYSDTTNRSSCLSAPAGHYAIKGSILAALCPAGTHDPHTNSPSAEFCEADAPDTYSGEGAAEATPCPAGMHSPARASSCSAGSDDLQTAPSIQISTGTGTTSQVPAAQPAPISVLSLTAPAITVTITSASAKHRMSLLRKYGQHYLVSCSAAATVQLRASAVVQAGKQHLALTARTLTLKCKAAKPSEATASFKLSRTAKKLLRKHGASVKLTVRAYATGAAVHGLLASATVRGSA